MKNLIFIGMPGSGIKGIAKSAAEMLGKKYVDTDDVLVRNIGMPLIDIYTLIPINSFNDLVFRLGKQLSESEDYVIALGDSILTNPDAFAAVSSTGFTVYIDRDIDDVIKNCDEDGHPLLLRGRERLIPLYNERRELFKSADVSVPYSQNAAETAVSLFKAHLENEVSGSNALDENTRALRELIIKRIKLLHPSSDTDVGALAERCIKGIDLICE